eukprot:gene11226-23474_t
MSGTLQLYRSILKHAKRFPSIKRIKLVEEIRTSFRQNRHEINPDVLKQQISVAEKGLSQLMSYTSLSPQSNVCKSRYDPGSHCEITEFPSFHHRDFAKSHGFKPVIKITENIIDMVSLLSPSDPKFGFTGECEIMSSL